MDRPTKLADFDASDSLKSSGADLTEYREQLMKDRNARTLVMRRMQRPAIAGVLGMPRSTPRKASLFDQMSTLTITPEQLCDILKSQSLQRISDTGQAICQFASTSPQVISNLFTSMKAEKALVECLAASWVDDNGRINLMNIIAALFPKSPQGVQNAFIDDELISTLMGFLESTNRALVIGSLKLIGATCLTSSYAGDTVLSFGMHEEIVRLALSGDIVVSEACCECLNLVFTNKTNIDSDTFPDCIPMMNSLLHLPSPKCVASILYAMYSLTTNNSALVFDLDKTDLYASLPKMLEVKELVTPALLLLSNMASGTPSSVRILFENGLFPALMALMQTDQLSYTFKAMSSLIESVSSIMLPLLTLEFVGSVVSLVKSCPFGVKTEGTFFLSTLINHIEVERLPLFINSDVFDILTEMLSCGTSDIVIRCLDALIRLSEKTLSQDQREKCLALLRDSEVARRLDELTEKADNSMISYRAEFLLSLYEKTDK